ncbi:MAG: rRNA methyltransferase [Thermobacillus sp.]|uniref:small ribosomal subunit Rsm22 family protein n=1 Tax=Thermobacillus sp. TaxID=2108467 RepID=UPI000E3A08CA|nr:small ribosomal subunit Rsm22 family protein [Thermobacillus sp.]REK55353.1 MAG: rRNA methyltransferase [Thermobacillus sp.]
MELPQQLRLAIERHIQGMDHAKLKRDLQSLSERYRTAGGRGRRLLTEDAEAASYAIARMPATYGAVAAALNYALERTPERPETLLDCGAGTGAASWAADALLDLRGVTCLEREPAMIRLGRSLAADASPALRNADWVRRDLAKDDIPERAELVLASYVLNEMNEADRAAAVVKLWNAAERMLLIVEPGTPAAYRGLMAVREQLLRLGAHLAAPCPHASACPMEGEDWCHFRCRIPRSRLHKQLKDGAAPYEDEKFSYLAVTREPCGRAEARIIRRPRIDKGRIGLELCTPDGLRSVDVHKKDGELFKRARKAECGDAFSAPGAGGTRS